jgi:hypothetical protein
VGKWGSLLLAAVRPIIYRRSDCKLCNVSVDVKVWFIRSVNLVSVQSYFSPRCSVHAATAVHLSLRTEGMLHSFDVSWPAAGSSWLTTVHDADPHGDEPCNSNCSATATVSPSEPDP